MSQNIKVKVWERTCFQKLKKISAHLDINIVESLLDDIRLWLTRLYVSVRSMQVKMINVAVE